MGLRLGIDVGGTFTDLVLYDEASHALSVEKVPSVAADPSEGIVQGLLRLLRGADVRPGAVHHVAHGTTVATNALLERRGAATALVTTRGFRDLLEIARQKRPALYDLHARKPPPLVPRHRRHEVAERVTADGQVRCALDLADVERVLGQIAADGETEALAICFLYSFLAPGHERQVLERARARLPGVTVVASHEVHAEFREYERLSTTVANAYLAPRMSAYVRAFRRRVDELGIPAHPHINQSNGGTMSVEEAARVPVRTALSGPAAGVAGAAWIAAQAGFHAIATFDMGGTSTDVAFVRDGVAGLAFEREIGGVTLRVPMLDIHTVGAGGGSIAWRDSGGALKVGPQSAGADPGPACYGRGGEAATVTDANLVLGRLGAGGLAGGAVPLDPSRAEAAIGRLADGLGLLVEDVRTDLVRTHLAALTPERLPSLAACFADMEQDALRWFDREGVPAARRRLERWLDLRYVGQNFELILACNSDQLDVERMTSLVSDFHIRHREFYGYDMPGQPVELVNLRLVVTVARASPPQHRAIAGGNVVQALMESRGVWFSETGFTSTPVYARDLLPAGTQFDGPLIVEQMDATTVVPPKTQFKVDATGTMHLTLESAHKPLEAA